MQVLVRGRATQDPVIVPWFLSLDYIFRYYIMEVVVPKVKRIIVGKQDVRTPEEKRIATIEKVY